MTPNSFAVSLMLYFFISVCILHLFTVFVNQIRWAFVRIVNTELGRKYQRRSSLKGIRKSGSESSSRNNMLMAFLFYVAFSPAR